MIVKVQISLHTDEPVLQVLVYDRSRKYSVMVPLTEELSKTLLRGEKLTLVNAKQFWEAHLEDTEIVLDRRVKDKNW